MFCPFGNLALGNSLTTSITGLLYTLLGSHSQHPSQSRLLCFLIPYPQAAQGKLTLSSSQPKLPCCLPKVTHSEFIQMYLKEAAIGVANGTGPENSKSQKPGRGDCHVTILGNSKEMSFILQRASKTTNGILIMSSLTQR